MTSCRACSSKIGMLNKEFSCPSCHKSYCSHCRADNIIKVFSGDSGRFSFDPQDAVIKNGGMYFKTQALHTEMCKDCGNNVVLNIKERILRHPSDPNYERILAKRKPFGKCAFCGNELDNSVGLISPFIIFGDFPEETRIRVMDEWHHNYGQTGNVIGVYTRPLTNEFVIARSISCKKCGPMKTEYYLQPDKPVLQPDGLNIAYISILRGMDAEASGRFEEAGMFYDKAGETNWASNVRKEAKTSYVKQAVVNINELLTFLRSTNYTIPYKCPACSATIRLNKDRSEEKFLKCEYCGSGLQAIDIQNIINQFI